MQTNGQIDIDSYFSKLRCEVARNLNFKGHRILINASWNSTQLISVVYSRSCYICLSVYFESQNIL
jgi:hypothetical protein